MGRRHQLDAVAAYVMPEAIPDSGPYAQAAAEYWDAGWAGVLPLPARRKKEPPTGYTGENGAWPSRADIQTWTEDGHATGNIALRLPDNIIGIDVDCYDGKNGATTLTRLVAECGPLPATWTSSSRGDGSSIRFYRVPPGWIWPGDLGQTSGIEIIRHGYRYAVVWPSVHPEGRVYRWTSPDGVATLVIPQPGDTTELPAAWVDRLTSYVAEQGPSGWTDPDLDQLVEHGVPAGARQDDVLRDVVWQLRRQQVSRSVARAAWAAIVIQTPLTRPDEPWTDRDFDRHWSGADRKTEDPPPVTTLSDPQPADPFAKAVSFAELDTMSFRAPSYLVPKVIVLGGVVLLAGAPKIGKSHMALGIGLAVAQGNAALGAGEVTRTGPVLFISLDDTSAARAQERARTINLGKPLPAAMTLHTEHNLGRGEQARDNLYRYLKGRGKGTVLVVIDTLSHLRGERGHTEGVYDADVRFMALVRTLVPHNPDTTFLGLAHIRKMAADDGLQAVSGTYGITGGADSVITLTGNRHAPGRAIEVVNRDDAGGEYALKFTDHGLILTDDDPHDPALFMSHDDGLVYEALVKGGGPLGAPEIAAMLPGLTKVGDRLTRLVRHKAARKVSRGKYEAL